MPATAPAQTAIAQTFIAKWRKASGSERANYQLFITGLCDLLGCEKPDPSSEDTRDNAYVFERRVRFAHGDGSDSLGFIDCYKRAHFVLEAKKVKTDGKAFDSAMLRARGQAEQYERALPADEGRPPFVVVVDVGGTIHTFQILTKRSDRVAALGHTLPWPANVWMGVSVENAKVLDRIDDLRAVPAEVRFLSCEPLIGPLGVLDLTGIHWAIVGGESGPKARPMREEWAQDIRAQCEDQGVAFFFKQWGGVRKEKFGRELNGRTYDAMPRQHVIPVYASV